MAHLYFIDEWIIVTYLEIKNIKTILHYISFVDNAGSSVGQRDIHVNGGKNFTYCVDLHKTHI